MLRCGRGTVPPYMKSRPPTRAAEKWKARGTGRSDKTLQGAVTIAVERCDSSAAVKGAHLMYKRYGVRETQRDGLCVSVQELCVCVCVGRY